MPPLVRYPAGEITPHGAYHLLKGAIPSMKYRSYDDTVVFNMMGGEAIADRTAPEQITIKALKGLIPPWQNIKQKGATQDGSTYITSLYDEMEVDLTVGVRGRDAAHRRKVLRDWIASWDAKKAGELSWCTQELGRWWAPVRWAKQPVDQIAATFAQQDFIWTAIAYDGFWRSYDDVDSFRIPYNATTDTFPTLTTTGLGTGWEINYPNNIHITHSILYDLHMGGGNEAQFIDNDSDPVPGPGRNIVCRRAAFTTDTDNQVVWIELGSMVQWLYINNQPLDIWARVKNTGTPGTDGIRLRINYAYARLSAFVGGVETVLRDWPYNFPPMEKERVSLVCGTADNPRAFQLLHSRYGLLGSAVEAGTTSQLGANFRSVGFGQHVQPIGSGSFRYPAGVAAFGAGDNTPTTAASGFVTLTNVGDQDIFYRYTCFGPGSFAFGDGPGSNNYVSFGPLLDNQVVQVRSDPRKRGVVDLTSKPPTPQQLTIWQQVLNGFLSFASGGNLPPLFRAIESIFGIAPPQGNLYSLLHGRFSKPIPAKSPGRPAQAVKVPVAISGGNSNSMIIAAGTPLRRFPY